MTDDAAQEKAPEKNPVPAFLIAMLFYLCLVYANTLYIYPMGRDYCLLSVHCGYDTLMPRSWITWEIDLFGKWVPGYHLMNLILLYGCMVALFFLTRHVVRGPWWMGSLAAVLFMANPVKSEAVLNLTGIQDLLPVFLALVSLACYAAHVRNSQWEKYLLSIVLFAPAMYWARSHLALVLAYVLIEIIIADRQERRLWRCIPFLLLFLFIAPVEMKNILRHNSSDPWDFMGMFMPLHLIPYPIGFFPETLEGLQEQYGYVFVYCTIFVGVIIGLAYASHHRAFVFGILAAMSLRLYQGNNPFDVVHMIGGGQLLLPVAFISIAFAALVHRVIQHPKWLRPMIFLTAVLCVVFFGLQFQMNMIWRYAGQQIQVFQKAVIDAKQKNPDAHADVLANYRCYRGAPIDLLEAIRHETPFSEMLGYDSWIELSRNKKEWYDIEIIAWAEDSSKAKLRPSNMHAWRQRGTRYNASIDLLVPDTYKEIYYEGGRIPNHVEEQPDGSVRLTLHPTCCPFPSLVRFKLARPWIDW